jgi:O-antigen/teichoic acid export membrane protein
LAIPNPSKKSLWPELKKLTSFGACEGISRGLNWGLMVLLPLILLPDEYGIVGLTVPLIMIGGNILRLGQSRTILRYYYNHREKGRFVLFQITLWAGISVFCLVVLASLKLVSIDSLLGLSVFPHLFLTGLCIALTNLIFIGATVARAEQNTVDFARFRIGENSLKAIFVLLLSYLVPRASSYLVGFIIGSGLLGVWTFRYLKARSSGPQLPAGVIRQHLLFGLPFVFHMIATNLLNFVGRFQVRTYLDTDSVGIFTLATTLGFSLTIGASILAVYFEPRIYREAGDQEASSFWLSVFSWSALIFGSAASLFALLVLPLALKQFYPPEYLAVLPHLPILFAASLIRVFYLQGNYRLALIEKPGWILAVTVVSLMAHFLLNLYLIPARGLDGAIMSYFISVIVLSLSLLLLSVMVSPRGSTGLSTLLPYLPTIAVLLAIGLIGGNRFQIPFFGALVFICAIGLGSVIRKKGNYSL